MKIVVGEAKLIKKTMDSISTIVDEALIIFDKDGLSLKALSEDLQVGIKVNMNREAFIEYNVEKSEKVNINLSTFSKVLKRAKDKDKVVIVFEGERQYITIEGSLGKFDIPLCTLELDEGRIKIPKIKYSTVVEFEPKLLSVAIRDILIFSEDITFEVDKEGLHFKNNANDRGVGQVHGTIIKDMLASFICHKDCTATFDTTHLKDILKVTGISGTIKMSIKTDNPLMIEFNSPVSKVAFIVVPIIS